MKDVRIVPISMDSVTVQVTCDCGNEAVFIPCQNQRARTQRLLSSLLLR